MRKLLRNAAPRPDLKKVPNGLAVMKLALIADTHIPDRIPALPASLLSHLRSVDMILHAGGFTCLEVLETLRAITETVAVYGNADELDISRQLPDRRLLSLAGRRIGLIHGHRTYCVLRIP
jgi:hypothetical protein